MLRRGHWLFVLVVLLSSMSYAGEPRQRVFLPDDLRRILIGKSPQEIITIIGRPNGPLTTLGEIDVWRYGWFQQPIPQFTVTDPILGLECTAIGVNFRYHKVFQ